MHLFVMDVALGHGIGASGFQITSLIPLILDQYKLRKRLTSAKVSKKIDFWGIFGHRTFKNPNKTGFMCHCNRFFVTVTAFLLVLMNRGFQKLSL